MEANKIITYKDKLCIKAKVVMLPTKEKTNIIKHNIGVLYKYKEPVLATHGYTNQHLYIITDEKIEKDDWVYDGELKKICHCNTDLLLSKHVIKHSKKIIATTDNLLITPTDWKPEEAKDIKTKLPQPSQAFIEAYCKAEGIDEVLVEVEVKKLVKPFDVYSEETILAKTDSHNTISIHPVEEKVYSREEVEKLCAKAWDKSVEVNRNLGKIGTNNFKKWIEENLN